VTIGLSLPICSTKQFHKLTCFMRGRYLYANLDAPVSNLDAPVSTESVGVSLVTRFPAKS